METKDHAGMFNLDLGSTPNPNPLSPLNPLTPEQTAANRNGTHQDEAGQRRGKSVRTGTNRDEPGQTDGTNRDEPGTSTGHNRTNRDKAVTNRYELGQTGGTNRDKAGRTGTNRNATQPDEPGQSRDKPLRTGTKQDEPGQTATLHNRTNRDKAGTNLDEPGRTGTSRQKGVFAGPHPLDPNFVHLWCSFDCEQATHDNYLWVLIGLMCLIQLIYDRILVLVSASTPGMPGQVVLVPYVSRNRVGASAACISPRGVRSQPDSTELPTPRGGCPH